MKTINIETLMGHSLGTSDSYYRITEKDLLKDYLKAGPGVLTINGPEKKLQAKISEIEQKGKEGIYGIEGRLYEKGRQEIRLLRQRDEMNTDAISALSDKLAEVAKEVEAIKQAKIG